MGAEDDLQPTALFRPLCHEVGNLLAAIRLCAHLLKDTEPPEERRRTAREVERLAGQAGSLLAQMRPLVDARAAESRVRVTADSLLASVARAVEEEVPEGVRWRVERDAELPDVRVDTEAIHHLLVTLLLGALEAVAPEGGEVRLSARLRGDEVVLTLLDDGPPLAVESGAAELSRGRELALRLAAAVLAPSRAWLRVLPDARRGNRIEIGLAVAQPAQPRGEAPQESAL